VKRKPNGSTMIERRKYQRNDLMAGVQYARSSETLSD